MSRAPQQRFDQGPIFWSLKTRERILVWKCCGRYQPTHCNLVSMILLPMFHSRSSQRWLLLASTRPTKLLHMCPIFSCLSDRLSILTLIQRNSWWRHLLGWDSLCHICRLHCKTLLWVYLDFLRLPIKHSFAPMYRLARFQGRLRSTTISQC